jgi:hypothetical protein
MPRTWSRRVGLKPDLSGTPLRREQRAQSRKPEARQGSKTPRSHAGEALAQH